MAQGNIFHRHVEELIEHLQSLEGPQYKIKAHQYQVQSALDALKHFLQSGDLRWSREACNRFERLLRAVPRKRRQEAEPILHNIKDSAVSLAQEDREYVLLALTHPEAGISEGLSDQNTNPPLLEQLAIHNIPPIPTLLQDATVETVCQILRRVPAGLRRWTWENKPRTRRASSPRMWHIDNEYHVQSLLWFLLCPLFLDLKDEEYTPSVAHLHPRADICIPRLKLIIEVKFWRSNKRYSKLVEEIAADASLYLAADSMYENIVAVIWDNAAHSEQHDFLVQGLKKIKGIVDVIVIGRPGVMNIE